MKNSIFIALFSLLLVGCVSDGEQGLTYGMSTAELKEAPDTFLCLDAYHQKITDSAYNELASRKVNCTPSVQKVYKEISSTAPPFAICEKALFGSNDIVTPIINKEIKHRGLDCSVVVQAEYARRGAIASEEAARAQRMQAFAAISNSYKANRPVNTSCYNTGYGHVNCTSY